MRIHPNQLNEDILRGAGIFGGTDLGVKFLSNRNFQVAINIVILIVWGWGKDSPYEIKANLVGVKVHQMGTSETTRMCVVQLLTSYIAIGLR